jgi:hypothetical protein
VNTLRRSEYDGLPDYHLALSRIVPKRVSLGQMGMIALSVLAHDSHRLIGHRDDFVDAAIEVAGRVEYLH